MFDALPILFAFLIIPLYRYNFVIYIPRKKMRRKQFYSFFDISNFHYHLINTWLKKENFLKLKKKRKKKNKKKKLNQGSVNKINFSSVERFSLTPQNSFNPLATNDTCSSRGAWKARFVRNKNGVKPLLWAKVSHVLGDLHFQ